ncbi:chaperonin 60 subunit alpha 2, chloroplastic-like isoform X1 [Populus nigra]|uniref:chaperonin 60 subunit alpha 2, chloroplastic-like isoform X1 n=1 Tax=Populus nigra TaxID=3691 RepID=UPI002B26AB54|nr:chaperonin 60 subunit alpha 2, chloroplastic-like isoform X1 [Populus nigra]
MNDLAGGDTTTAIILACEMIETAMLAVAFGANPVSVEKGMDVPVKDLVKVLKKNSFPVKGKDDIKAVASISAGNDEYVGNLIAETIENVGSDGVISLESSWTSDTCMIIEGMKGSNRVAILCKPSGSHACINFSTFSLLLMHGYIFFSL